MKSRNLGIEILRIICALMVLTYHFINTCVNVTSFSMGEQFIIYNIFWGGGRLAVNVFVIISAWFLCEKEINGKHLLEIWLTLLIYFIPLGVYYLVTQQDTFYFIRQLTPVSSQGVWFVSIYIMMILVSPVLNKILEFKSINVILLACFVLFCVEPTIYPKAVLNLDGHNFTWFCLLYLFTGALKKKNVSINKWVCLIIFGVCWEWNILWRLFWDKYICSDTLVDYGFFRDIFFGNKYAITMVVGSFALFFFFKDIENNQIVSKFCKRFEKIIIFVAAATLDVYVLLSANNPSGSLFWCVKKIRQFCMSGVIILRAYLVIVLAFICAILIGKVRKVLTGTIANYIMRLAK